MESVTESVVGAMRAVVFTDVDATATGEPTADPDALPEVLAYARRPYVVHKSMRGKTASDARVCTLTEFACQVSSPP